MKKHTKINYTYSGSRGWTQKLLEVHGEKKVKSYYIEHGSRKTAYYFGVPPSTIDHLKIIKHWRRPMEKVPHILWGVARGNVDPDDYPHLSCEIPKSPYWRSRQKEMQLYAYYLLKKDTFIGWCLLNQGFTYCLDIYLWLKGDKKMDWVETYDDIIQAMKEDNSGYFEPRHFDKVHTVYDYYKNKDPYFTFKDQGETP